MRFRRRKTQPEQRQRANPTRIAVLEHDLLGIQPEPGSAAALTVALRKAAANCVAHEPIETSTFATPGRVGLCMRCGCSMLQDVQGEWVKA